jgi:hypothetical protein
LKNIALFFVASTLSTRGFSASAKSQYSQYPIYGDESIMSKKAHGTSEKPAQSILRFGCDPELADKICNFNRRFAESSGYAFGFYRSWLKEIQADGVKEVTYHDSVTGKPLFIAP